MSNTVSSIAGVTDSNVSSINGVLAANISTIDGITFTSTSTLLNTLYVDPESILFEGDGTAVTSNTVSVTTDPTINWTVTSNQSWCTVSPSSGTGTGEFTVTAQVSMNSRTASITVTCVYLSRYISITQNGS